MVACHALQSVSTRIMWVAVQRTTISALGVRNAKSPPQQDSVTAALGSHPHKQSLRATCLWQTRRVRCGLFRQSHGSDIRNMSPLPRSSFIINLPILVLFLLLAHSHLVPAKTIIHFYAHTSCNVGTAIGAPFTGDAAAAETCQFAPNSTVALYVDGINEACTG
jgi:hypothetical protein